nr:11465_t:CDS:2 [Entrophospora candida]
MQSTCIESLGNVKSAFLGKEIESCINYEYNHEAEAMPGLEKFAALVLNKEEEEV